MILTNFPRHLHSYDFDLDNLDEPYYTIVDANEHVTEIETMDLVCYSL